MKKTLRERASKGRRKDGNQDYQGERCNFVPQEDVQAWAG